MTHNKNTRNIISSQINPIAQSYIEKIAQVCKRIKPKVVISCITYNHEPYICDALEGFIMQKTDFPFVAIVHDDASTDGTANIVKEYAKKYSDIILPVLEEENQYSIGNLSTIIKETIEVSGAEYIAMCEGDDYFIDVSKLQKQVDALESYPCVDACTHKQIQFDAITKEKLRIKTHGEKIRILPVKDVILGEGGFVGTNTMMYRSECILNSMKFRKFMDYDYTSQIQGALRGGILYIPQCSSAYNANVPQSFCSRMKKDKKASIQYINDKMKMLDMLDEDTENKYHNIITARKLLYTVTSITPFLTNIKNFHKYHSGYKELSFKEKVMSLLRITISPIRVLFTN